MLTDACAASSERRQVNATDTDQIVMTDKNTTPDTPPSHPTQKMPPQKTPRAAAELKLPWRGLGVWNVLFHFEVCACLLQLSQSRRSLECASARLFADSDSLSVAERLRGLAAVAAGAALAYSESCSRHCEPHNECSRGAGILTELRD